MDPIKKKYIIDENKNKVAVQIDIADFEKIEQVMEDYALGKLMEDNDPADSMSIQEAKSYYKNLDKE